MRRAARLALGATLLLPGAAPRAQPLPRDVLPGLGAADPRRPVDPAAAPWRSLGRVQLEVGGRCTGALVGPRTVLTAAHCLVAPRARTLVRPGTVHLLLGYHLGTYAAHARVAAYQVGSGFDPTTGGPAAADWAVLTLEAALSAPPLPLLRTVPAAGTPLVLAGYQQDRPEVLLADSACHLLGESPATGGALLLHDCAGTRGTSGAPLLVRTADGGWAVAGIAARTARDAARGVAVPAAAIPDLAALRD